MNIVLWFEVVISYLTGIAYILGYICLHVYD